MFLPDFIIVFFLISFVLIHSLFLFELLTNHLWSTLKTDFLQLFGSINGIGNQTVWKVHIEYKKKSSDLSTLCKIYTKIFTNPRNKELYLVIFYFTLSLFHPENDRYPLYCLKVGLNLRNMCSPLHSFIFQKLVIYLKYILEFSYQYIKNSFNYYKLYYTLYRILSSPVPPQI